MTGIEGKVVAITGASSGIGEATARLLAERGAKVVLGARRVQRLDDIADEIREHGGQAFTCPADVASSADLDRLVGAVRTTSISPGFVDTQLDSSIDDEALREQIRRTMTDFGIPPAAIARAIAFAIEQPDDVEIGDITIRPTAQG
jgi:NADP-dependent 3-hydroxy acid dehydrogenase YdfG